MSHGFTLLLTLNHLIIYYAELNPSDWIRITKNIYNKYKLVFSVESSCKQERGPVVMKPDCIVIYKKHPALGMFGFCFDQNTGFSSLDNYAVSIER